MLHLFIYSPKILHTTSSTYEDDRSSDVTTKDWEKKKKNHPCGNRVHVHIHFYDFVRNCDTFIGTP